MALVDHLSREWERIQADKRKAALDAGEQRLHPTRIIRILMPDGVWITKEVAR